MIDPLASIGIEQGKPFKPDQEATGLFAATGAAARAWFDVRYETGYAPHNSGFGAEGRFQLAMPRQ